MIAVYNFTKSIPYKDGVAESFSDRKDKSMFEQDYILREIHQMIAAIMKFVFGMDVGSSASWAIDNLEKREKSDALLRMIDNGEICEAIEELYHCTEKNKDDLLISFNFFSHLCGKSEDFYEEYNLCFEDVEKEMKVFFERYGLTEEMFNLIFMKM